MRVRAASRAVTPEAHAAYDDDTAAAQEDFKGLKAVGDTAVVAAVVLNRGADGKVSVKEHGGGLVAGGTALGAVGGFVIGLFAPPLLLATAVGAGIGAGVGAIMKHHEEKEIGVDADEWLPAGSSAIVAVVLSLQTSGPMLLEALSWLRQHLPVTDEITLVHGDYRLGNLALDPNDPGRVVAIFDWEQIRGSSRAFATSREAGSTVPHGRDTRMQGGQGPDAERSDDEFESGRLGGGYGGQQLLGQCDGGRRHR